MIVALIVLLCSPEIFDLYALPVGTGKRNKVVRLPDKKVKYIIRLRPEMLALKNIALDVKVSESTVKRVWIYCLKHHEAIVIKKFGRKKKEIDEKSELLSWNAQGTATCERRHEEIIKFKNGI